MNNKPLSGIRVIDFSAYLAAPVTSRLMADWGADVIKVEALIPDVQRTMGANFLMSNKEDENPAWETANANKRGIVVDVKCPEGHEIIHKLLAQADVFITNTRPNSLQKLQLDYESLKEKYPKLVYAQLTGYGSNGPDVNEPGFDAIAFWARSGFVLDMVEPGQTPVYPLGGVGDTITGTALFGGVCAALVNSQRTGQGDKIDISLYGSAIWAMGIQLICSQPCYGYKFPKYRKDANPMATSYRCKDGEWVSIAILAYLKQFPIFCKIMGLEDLITDERFSTFNEFSKNRAELLPILEKAFATKTSKEWDKLLKEGDVVHTVLRHYTDVHKDEQALANNFLIDHTFPNGEHVLMPSPPLRSAVVGEPPREKAPYFGENTKEVLEELGYSPQQINEMAMNKKIMVR